MASLPWPCDENGPQHFIQDLPRTMQQQKGSQNKFALLRCDIENKWLLHEIKYELFHTESFNAFERSISKLYAKVLSSVYGFHF